MIVYVILYYSFLRNRIDIWDTLEHELTHALFAVLTFNRIDSISAGGKGGEVKYSGRGNNILITLSPYFFPTFLIVFLPLKVILAEPYIKYWFFIAGVLTCYYILSTIKESHINQTDLRVYGLIYSYLLIMVLNILILGSIGVYFLYSGETVYTLWSKTLIALKDNLFSFFG